MQGKIKSLDQPVSDFFPQYKTGRAAKLTVGDLSTMSSGLAWDERYYSPFSITTRAYFDDDLSSTILKLPITEIPGKKFKYLSGNTQLLAMVLEKAVNMPLSKYISENFWKPMGAEQEALWQTDREGGIVKAFCCFASTARDFARFGKLYMQNGKWNGVQLLDSAFVAKSIVPHFAAAPQYGYGWWLGDYDGKDMYYMRGHLGQYTIVIPTDKIIIVRLGHQLTPGDAASIFPMGIMDYIDGAYKMLKPQGTKP
jgi:CubicO group peptidase (beta-lactamase class C family)